MKDFTGFADETRDNDRSLKPSQRGTIAKEPVPAGWLNRALQWRVTSMRFLRCAGGRPRHSIEHSKLEAALTSPVPL